MSEVADSNRIYSQAGNELGFYFSLRRYKHRACLIHESRGKWSNLVVHSASLRGTLGNFGGLWGICYGRHNHRSASPLWKIVFDS